MSGYTPGPWRWELNEKSKKVELCGGKPQFDLTVMGFTRYGMSSAAPLFRRYKDFGLLTRADQFGVNAPGRDHHSSWFKLIEHPDARLIAAAPDLLEALKMLHDDIAEYAKINNLGGFDNQVVRLARTAIAKAIGPDERTTDMTMGR